MSLSRSAYALRWLTLREHSPWGQIRRWGQIRLTVLSPSMGSDPVNGFELKDKRTRARVRPLTLSGSVPLTIPGSDPFGFEKLLANGGKVLPELAGISQRAVDAASPVADAASVPDTENGRQFTQRTERQLAEQPCGDVSADGLATTVAKYLGIDPVRRGNG